MYVCVTVLSESTTTANNLFFGLDVQEWQRTYGNGDVKTALPKCTAPFQYRNMTIFFWGGEEAFDSGGAHPLPDL